jgi:hypothetical protein
VLVFLLLRLVGLNVSSPRHLSIWQIDSPLILAFTEPFRPRYEFSIRFPLGSSLLKTLTLPLAKPILLPVGDLIFWGCRIW